jgi:YesN/AraC family two-component response regulator
MIADDDVDIRDSLHDWLTGHGYLVEVAADGLEALARLREEAFDVLVTDLRMPRLDGLALLAAIEAEPRRPQVIFLTGQATMTDAIAALREGRSFDFLEKPLRDMDHLTRVIERALQVGPAPPDAGPAWPPRGTYAVPVHAVLALVGRRFAEPLNLTDVSSAVGYNATYLSDLVARETGHPFSHWLTAARLAEARRLLTESPLSVREVAQASGFPDPNYFSRVFRQSQGQTPLAWRNQQRAAKR